MPELQHFSTTTKAIVGTMMAIGITPITNQGGVVSGFATFDHNGKTVSYIIKDGEDLAYLLKCFEKRLNNISSLFSRDDWHASIKNGKLVMTKFVNGVEQPVL